MDSLTVPVYKASKKIKAGQEIMSSGTHDLPTLEPPEEEGPASKKQKVATRGRGRGRGR